MFKGLACSFLFGFYSTFYSLAAGEYWYVSNVGPGCTAPVAVGLGWKGVASVTQGMGGELWYTWGDGSLQSAGFGSDVAWVNYGDWQQLAGDRVPVRVLGRGWQSPDDWFEVTWGKYEPPEYWYVSNVGPGCTASVVVGLGWKGVASVTPGMGGEFWYTWGDGSLQSAGFGSDVAWVNYGDWQQLAGDRVPVRVLGRGWQSPDDWFEITWGRYEPPEYWYVSNVGPGCTASVVVGLGWKGVASVTLGMGGEFWYTWGDGSLQSAGFGSDVAWVNYGDWQQLAGDRVPVRILGRGWQSPDDWFEITWGVWPPPPPPPNVTGLVYTDWRNVQWYIWDARNMFPIPLYTFEGTNFSWSVTSGVYFVSARVSMPDITDEVFSEPFAVGGLGWSTNIVMSYYVTNSVVLQFHGQYGTPLGGAMVEIYRRSCDRTYIPPPYLWFSLDPTVKPPADWYPGHFAEDGWIFWDNVSTVNYLRTDTNGIVRVTLPNGIYMAHVWDNRLKNDVWKEFRVGEGYYEYQGHPAWNFASYSVYCLMWEDYVVYPFDVTITKYQLFADRALLDCTASQGQAITVLGSEDLRNWNTVTNFNYSGEFYVPRIPGKDSYFWKLRSED